jgi:MOSC domain-containing protein YiiM
VAHLSSVNIGRPRPNPYKETKATGIGKVPQEGPIEVRAPGPKHGGLGSGLVGDFVGDVQHHGGNGQAVYAFQREDLDRWAERLGRDIPNGFFGENLTTVGLEVNEARIGERWQIGKEVVLQVVSSRTPCSTFRGQMGVTGWLKLFTADARPGAYLSVVSPGTIRAGDPVQVIRRPEHDVTVSLMFRALSTEPELLPRLLPAGDDLEDETRAEIALARR